ncbi:hypothetical protein VPH35_040245 [Triticum aestivum]|uniref:Uncharacterized protein n=1 Tax=Aegilops tauschii subsp. strangulata TaxID=200361 RepID=A0A453D493_AEGTS
MKELQVKVKEVNERNLRYHLLNGASGSNPTSAATELSSDATTMMFGMRLKMTALLELINNKDDDLSVISVWGTGSDIGLTSFVRASYENSGLKMKFPCRAWVRVMHPFSPTEFTEAVPRCRLGC